MGLFMLLNVLCFFLPNVVYAAEINETTESSSPTPSIRNETSKLKRIKFAAYENQTSKNVLQTCPFGSCSENIRNISNTYRDAVCACDKDCIEFRDCCYDSEYYNQTEQEKPSVYECQTIEYRDYFTINTCASSWSDEEILEKCAMSRNHDLNTENLELRIPATSVTTNITYGNIFCALCNHDVDDVLMWNITVENSCASTSQPCLSLNYITKSFELSPHCKQLEDPSTLEFSGSRWYFVHNQTSYYCELTLAPPANVQLKLCYRYNFPVISTCLKNWTDSGVAEQCHGPYSRIFDKRGNPYKNKFCAYCNGIADFALMCPPTVGFHTAVLQRTTIFSSYSGHRAFSVLFDFKPKILSKICNEKKQSYSEVKKRMCPDHENQTKRAEPENWFFTGYTSLAILTSLVFLIIHLTIFSVVKELHTIGGKNIASFCIALVFAYSSFLIGNHVKGGICFVVAVVMYYSFLSAFSWMLTISYDMWKTFWNATKKFRSPTNPKKTFFVYSLWSWSVPLIPVLVTVYLDFSAENFALAPRFGNSGCWFSNGYSLFLFFVAPVCVIIVVNFAFFLHTSCMLYSNQCESVNRKSRVDFKLFARIALLTGFTWITGFVAGFTQSVIVWFVFIVLNTAQGVLIFTAFSCKKRIILSFLKRTGKFEGWQESLQQSKVKSNDTASTQLNRVANKTV